MIKSFIASNKLGISSKNILPHGKHPSNEKRSNKNYKPLYDKERSSNEDFSKYLNNKRIQENMRKRHQGKFYI